MQQVRVESKPVRQGVCSGRSMTTCDFSGKSVEVRTYHGRNNSAIGRKSGTDHRDDWTTLFVDTTNWFRVGAILKFAVEICGGLAGVGFTY